MLATLRSKGLVGIQLGGAMNEESRLASAYEVRL